MCHVFRRPSASTYGPAGLKSCSSCSAFNAAAMRMSAARSAGMISQGVPYANRLQKYHPSSSWTSKRRPEFRHSYRGEQIDRSARVHGAPRSGNRCYTARSTWHPCRRYAHWRVDMDVDLRKSCTCVARLHAERLEGSLVSATFGPQSFLRCALPILPDAVASAFEVSGVTALKRLNFGDLWLCM